MVQDDDEVSTVLRHFKPKPEFIARSSEVEWATVDRKRRKFPRDRGFSSIRYMCQERKLRLSYLHDRSLFLKFDVSTFRPMNVTCVCCNGPGPSGSDKELRQEIEDLCRKISPADAADNSSNTTSLFSVVSRLLRSLNHDLPGLRGANATAESGTVLRSMVSQSLTPAARRILDLEILLLRCAAAGRNRATLCTGRLVPVEYTGDADLIARCIFAYTDRLGLVTQLVPPSCSGQASNVSEQRHEQALLAFLLSLPWAEGGKLAAAAATSTADGNNRKGSTGAIHLCLDIGTAALGDESPRFAGLIKRRGVVTAYHGTKIENAWSILNYGLQNLSYHNTLSQNGAMMGSGVYLSTSYDVACFFAKNDARYSPALLQAWRHPSLLRLLYSYAVADAKPGLLDEYSVSCYPVFEATIIAPPEATSKDDDEKKDCTRREGKYFVVPNSDDIRITKLHLTLELTKKRSAWPPAPLLFIIAIGVTFWMLQ